MNHFFSLIIQLASLLTRSILQESGAVKEVFSFNSSRSSRLSHLENTPKGSHERGVGVCPLWVPCVFS